MCNAIIFFYTGFRNDVEWPKELAFLNTFFYLMGNLLDNCDGKQARKTNSASPLGMIFDHGLDCTTTFLFPCTLSFYIYCDKMIEYVPLWIMYSFHFYLNSWEQYMTGEFNMPVVHGVSEGTIVSTISFILTGLFGNACWVKTVTIFGFPLMVKQIFGIIFMFMGVFIGIMSIITVIKRLDRARWNQGLVDLIIIFIFYFSFTSVVLFTDSTIVKERPALMIMTYGMIYAKFTGILQVAHLKGARYNPYTIGVVVPLVLLTVYAWVYGITGISLLISIDTLVYGVLIWSTVGWFYFFHTMTNELCEILNINKYSFGPRHKSKKEKLNSLEMN